MTLVNTRHLATAHGASPGRHHHASRFLSHDKVRDHNWSASQGSSINDSTYTLLHWGSCPFSRQELAAVLTGHGPSNGTDVVLSCSAGTPCKYNAARTMHLHLCITSSTPVYHVIVCPNRCATRPASATMTTLLVHRTTGALRLGSTEQGS